MPDSADSAATLPALSLIYRGTLASCNYSCHYCPFAKRQDSRQRLAKDAAELARFVAWVAAQQRPLRIFFTPWGEALVRRHYRQAVLALAALPQVQQVVLQTNLSGPLGWLAVPPDLSRKIALWCTYHPDQTTLPRFLARCQRLRDWQIAFSVGVVALRAHLPAIDALRAALPPDCYVWVNAYDHRGPRYYSEAELARLIQIDPWFGFSHKPVPSRGAPCRAGQEVLAVDGDGEVQRCHFVPQRLGNLYQDNLAGMLAERPCPRHKCDCFIGYVQRTDLPLQAGFGAAGVLPRIPVSFFPDS